MTSRDGFERTVATWLRAEAPDRGPAYLDEISAAIGRTRQRRAWANPQRWLGGVASPWTPSRLPRTVWLAGLLVLLVGAAVAAGVLGSRPTTFPWSGPGANGLIAFEFEGRIVVANLDGTGRRDLTPAAAIAPTGVTSDGRRCCDSSMAWSPDGKRLAFLRLTTMESDQQPQYDLMVVDASGADLRVVAAGLQPAGATGLGPIGSQARAVPAWSPDGRSLALSVYEPRANAGVSSTLLVADADGGPLRHPLPPSFWSARGPAWSPDGRQIAFVGYATDPKLDLVDTNGVYVVNVDGSGVRRASTRVMSGDAGYGAPVWVPGGRSLVADYEAHGSPGAAATSELVVLSADGATESAIGTTLTAESLAVSPDGRRIAYFVLPRTGTPDGNSLGLAVADLPSGVETVLVPDGLQPGYPVTWAPDGKRVLVLSALTDTVRLWAVDAAGLTPPTELLLGSTPTRTSGGELITGDGWDRELTYAWQRLDP